MNRILLILGTMIFTEDGNCEIQEVRYCFREYSDFVEKHCEIMSEMTGLDYVIPEMFKGEIFIVNPDTGAKFKLVKQ